MDIQNVVALVTGAGSGLGLATCQALVAAGAKVMAVDVDEERLVNNVLPLGSSVRIQRVDVSNDAEVKAAVDFAVQAFGSLQVAVNCAGILGPCKTLSKGELFPLSLWNQVIAVNLTGTFNVIRHASLAMSRNTASEDGERGVISSSLAMESSFYGLCGYQMRMAWVASGGWGAASGVSAPPWRSATQDRPCCWA